MRVPKVPLLVASVVVLLLAACRTAPPLDETPPAMPTGVVAEARDGGFALDWDPNVESDLEGYAVSWGEPGEPSIGNLFVAAPGTSTDVTGLTNDAEYEYRLAAEDRAGNSSPAATGTVTPIDMSPPTVTEVGFEYDNATHRGSLLLSFSEAMDKAATESALSLTPLVACTMTWPSDSQLDCANFPVEQYSTVSLELAATAADLTGNSLAESYVEEFEVGDLLPRLTSVSPSVGALHVDPMAPISMTFSEPVLTVIIGRWFIVQVDGNFVSGDAEWTADDTGLTFTPSEPYGYSKVVTWSVGGLIDFDLNQMTPLPQGSFTTEFQIGPGG